MGIYTTLLYQPILNFFIGLYNFIPDAGIVIIILTVIVRLILYPFYKKQVQAQKSMQDLQPKMNEIKEKYKDDKEKQAMEMMQLYKTNKVNPLSSCLPLLIQLPIFLAVYQVLRDGLTNSESLDLLYGFVARPEMIDPMFLGTVNLAERSIVLAVMAGVAQFWQAKMLVSKKPEVKGEGSKDEDTMAMMNKQMTYFMPVMIIFFGLTLPSGLSLYWVVSTLFMVAQQYIAFREPGDGTKIDEKTQVLPKNG
jgi:YidC/Oxa1 family membrane protein insertase